MRHRLALGLVTLAACAGAPAPTTAPTPGRPGPIRADELRRDLTVFASDSFAGRETGTRAATREIRPDWDLSAPGLREAWAAGDRSPFHGWDRRSNEPVAAT